VKRLSNSSGIEECDNFVLPSMQQKVGNSN